MPTPLGDLSYGSTLRRFLLTVYMRVSLTSAMETGGGDVLQWSGNICSGI